MKNSSEEILLSSEVSFDSSEVLFVSSEEFFLSSGAIWEIPREESESSERIFCKAFRTLLISG